MDNNNEDKNVLMVCSVGMANYLIGKEGDSLKKSMLIAGWIPEDDNHVWIIDGDKWAELFGKAEVATLKEGIDG